MKINIVLTQWGLDLESHLKWKNTLEADPTWMYCPSNQSVRWGSAVCVPSTRLYDLLTTPGFAPDEVVGGLLISSHIWTTVSTHFLDSLWCKIALVDGARRDILNLMNMNHICGTGEPVHRISAFIFAGSTDTVQALSCSRWNPRPTAPSYGLTRGLWISSRYLMAVTLPLVSSWRTAWHSKEMPLYTSTDPLPLWPCWRISQRAEGSSQRLQTLPRLLLVLSVNLLSSFICEEHRAPVANMTIFSGKYQTSCTVLGFKNSLQLWMLVPHNILMESGLQEVILQSSGHALPDFSFAQRWI